MEPSKKIRGLPRGGKTRDELKALIKQKGSISEAEVLAHINSLSEESWTHEDFINFFEKSGQVVFRHRFERLFLKSDSESSEKESLTFEDLASCSDCDRSQLRILMYKENIVKTKKLCQDISSEIRSLKDNIEFLEFSATKTPTCDIQSSASTLDKIVSMGTSVECSSKAMTPSEIPKIHEVVKPFRKVSDVEKKKAGSDSSSNGSSSSYQEDKVKKQRFVLPRYRRKSLRRFSDSDSDEKEYPYLKSKEEVYKLVNSRRRLLTKSNVEKMVTMDPDPKNQQALKITLSSTDDTSDSSSERCHEVIDRFQISGSSSQRAEPLKPSKAPLSRKPIQEPHHIDDDDDDDDVDTRGGYALTNTSSALRNLFRAKEDKEFQESFERNHEILLKDICAYGNQERKNAEIYFNYFLSLQKNVDCLSNGHLVAGTLALIEADPNQKHLKRLLACKENITIPS